MTNPLHAPYCAVQSFGGWYRCTCTAKLVRLEPAAQPDTAAVLVQPEPARRFDAESALGLSLREMTRLVRH